MLFIIGLITIILILKFTVGNNFDKRLAANHMVACGNIIEMRGGKGVNVIYAFVCNNKKIVVNVSSPKKTLQDYKNGKTKILIVFEKDNPRNNSILSKDEDFTKYQITSQDTLNVSCN